MAKLTEEQRQQRAAKRALSEALKAEADDLRRRERSALWEREGTRLSREEYLAGDACRGCGKPMNDQLGDWVPLLKLSEAERADYDKAQEAYRAQHSECRSGGWSISGSRTTHCCFCCPPPPMGPQTLRRLADLMASWPSYEERKKDLDTWNLILRCDHVVPFIQHRDNTYVSERVADCPECGDRRGVLRSERVGPAYPDAEVGKQHATVNRYRIAQELAAAEAKLARQSKTAATTQRRIQELREQLRDDA